MKTEKRTSSLAVALSGAGAFFLTACLQSTDVPVKESAKTQTSIDTPAQAAELLPGLTTKASAGDTVAAAQLARLRALLEAGITSGPEFDAAVNAIRTALGDKGTLVIDTAKGVDPIDAKLKADMEALRAALLAGKTGPEVDALVEKIKAGAGDDPVVTLGIGGGCKATIDTSLSPAVKAASAKLLALLKEGESGDELKAAWAELRAARAADTTPVDAVEIPCDATIKP